MTTPEFILPASVEDKVAALKAAVAKKSPIELRLAGFSLVTMNIYYGLPDFPHLVGQFIRQLYDISPRFPLVNDFVGFWQREIDGPLREVVISEAPLVGPPQGWRNVNAELRLN